MATGQDENIGRGGIFSRWDERDTAALKTTGYYASSDAEGDFISVRNKLKWNTGTYRLTLYKSGYVPGKKIPENLSKKELMFSWGKYEHSWVTMKVKKLETGDSVVIGSLAFPGKTLQFPDKFALFLEHYGVTNIDFSHTNRNWDLVRNYKIVAMNYKQVPHIKLAFKNIRINEMLVKPVSIHLQYNGTHNPNQKEIKMPIPRFATLRYDSTHTAIQCETGRLFEW